MHDSGGGRALCVDWVAEGAGGALHEVVDICRTCGCIS